MKKHILPVTLTLFLLSLCSCQPEVRTMELSVPLTPAPTVQSGSVQIQTNPVNALDVLVAVETIAADNGLKPFTEPADDDILGLAEIDSDAPAAIQNWRHPEYPVYLTATRQKGEILLLLNYPAEAAADAKAMRLFNTVKTELTEKLSAFLNPPAAEEKPQ